MSEITWKPAKRKIGDLKDLPNNPRKISAEAMERLKERIRQRGFHDIVKIDTEGFILSGNQRKKALRALGMNDVYVLEPSRPLTKDERQKVILESNRNDGDWDTTILGEHYDVKTLLEVGFDPKELQFLTSSKDDREDVVPTPPEKATSKLGDIYQLGPHRLMCGDATNPDHVDALMQGTKADMVFTDPPYNVDYHGKGKKTAKGIEGDNQGGPEFEEFLYKAFMNYARLTKAGGGYYIFHASSTADAFVRAMNRAGIEVRNQMIWNKPTGAMGWGDYRWKHEPFFYAGAKGKQIQFYGDRTHTTVVDFQKTDEQLLAWAKRQRKAEQEGKTTVWTMKREPVGGYVHPTQKPVELITYALYNSSKMGDVVLDFFMGAGSTMIAAEKTGRVAYGMEVDPIYCDVIVKRWEDYSGGKAKKLK